MRLIPCTTFFALNTGWKFDWICDPGVDTKSGTNKDHLFQIDNSSEWRNVGDPLPDDESIYFIENVK